MRKHGYKHGDIRVRSFFAFFPVTICKFRESVRVSEETRWLERVKVRQQFSHISSFSPRWLNIEFVDGDTD